MRPAEIASPKPTTRPWVHERIEPGWLSNTLEMHGPPPAGERLKRQGIAHIGLALTGLHFDWRFFGTAMTNSDSGARCTARLLLLLRALCDWNAGTPQRSAEAEQARPTSSTITRTICAAQGSWLKRVVESGRADGEGARLTYT